MAQPILTNNLRLSLRRLTQASQAHIHHRPRLLLQSRLLRQSRLLSISTHLHYATSDNVPRVAQRSFWESLIPTFLRPSATPKAASAKPKSKEWNPATFFIVIFLLIGSQAVQMIALKNEFAAFSRRADAKIDLLREVIGRIQKGEDVDVEGLLGTGDKAKEKEWEEVLKELEREDIAWQKAKEDKRQKAREVFEEEDVKSIAADPEKQPPPSTTDAPRGFY